MRMSVFPVMDEDLAKSFPEVESTSREVVSNNIGVGMFGKVLIALYQRYHVTNDGTCIRVNGIVLKESTKG